MGGLPALDKLTIADFEARRQDAVTLEADGETMALSIAEISAIGRSERDGGAFSVVFRGPAEPAVDQAIHRLAFGDGDRVELFLVPLGPDADGMLYEAVFT